MILKRKSRYVMVEASRPIDLTDKPAWSQLRADISRFIGEKEYLDANPFLAEQIDQTKFIIRVNRGSEKAIVLAFSFIKLFNNSEIGFYTLKTSGTIRALKSKTIRAKKE
ncbi:MAG: Rpp14/Pop5 family protein [Candidatus Micrarchaeota archaeon]|nr:Rpp14/Pop5 family protein [Candidatus Micrarchaeota archaeon]